MKECMSWPGSDLGVAKPTIEVLSGFRAKLLSLRYYDGTGVKDVDMHPRLINYSGDVYPLLGMVLPQLPVHLPGNLHYPASPSMTRPRSPQHRRPHP